MSPSRQAKAAGLRNLKQAADITGQHPNTLTLWHRTKPELFEVVLAGCVVISERGSPLRDTKKGCIAEYFLNNERMSE